MAIANDLIFVPPITAVGAVSVPVNVGLSIGAFKASDAVVAYPFSVVVRLELVTYEPKVVVRLELVT